MAWTELNFGQYKGLTLPQVLFLDPDWFFWVYNEGRHQERGKLTYEFEAMYQKARNVKIPRRDTKDLEVRYYIDPEPAGGKPERGFSSMDICRRGRISYFEDKEDVFVTRDVIDFRVPWELLKKDKDGYNDFLKKVKMWLFGTRFLEIDMTRKECEAFFENPDNFVLTDDDATAFGLPPVTE